jgi:hypothetical protein
MVSTRSSIGDPVEVPVQPPPPPSPPPQPTTTWVDGTGAGGLNYGTPPDGWVRDPYGGAWYPADHPYVTSGWGGRDIPTPPPPPPPTSYPISVPEGPTFGGEPIYEDYAEEPQREGILDIIRRKLFAE